MKKDSARRLLLVLLFTLLTVGFTLRFWNLPQQLFFGPEQGIDTLVIKEMVDGRLRLIGPKTDIDGIFHGPHFYYLSAIPYTLSGGNPLFSISWAVLFSALAIILLYFTASELFGKKIALWSSIFYTVSYGAIVYSRWLSTHAFVPFFFLLWLYLFLHAVKYGKKRKFILPLSFFFAAFTAQLEILNVLYILPLLIFLIAFYHRKFSLTTIYIAFFIFFLSFSNFLFFDIRHNFLITHRIIDVLHGNAGFTSSFFPTFKFTLNVYFNEGAFFLFPWNLSVGKIIFALLLVVLLVSSLKREKFTEGKLILLAWFLIPVVVLGLSRQAALSQFFVILGPAYALLFAYVLNRFLSRVNLKAVFYIITAAFIIMQFLTFKTFLPKNKLVFFQATQPDLRFADQISSLDYIYHDAGKGRFSFIAYTIPYWMEQGWQYLFEWYGGKNYGFIPQKGEGGTFYILWQKDYNNLSYQKDWFAGLDQKSKILAEKQFGEVHVQKRLNVEK